jgi:hypothetical protein
MESFFDEYGRDRVILDWIVKNKPMMAAAYRYVLCKNLNAEYQTFNDLMFIAFEAGIDFSRATSRDSRKE